MQIPSTFGNYRVEAQLGAGGQGETYVAVAIAGPLTGVRVALKVPPSHLQSHPQNEHQRREIESAIRGMQTEIEVHKEAKHPNLAEMLDYGTVNGVWYIASRLIHGCTLFDLMRIQGSVKPLPPDLAVFIVRGIAGALGEVHKIGVVHRDVKPGNVMVGTDGQPGLIDLGVAKVGAVGLDAMDYSHHVGTYRYWAPEQVMGEVLSGATDIFALGICLAEMVTGRHPFEDQRGDRDTLLRNIAEVKLVYSLDDFDLPQWLVDVIKRCFRRRPAERFATGGAFYDALSRQAEVILVDDLAAAQLGGQLAVDGAEVRQRMYQLHDDEQSVLEVGGPASEFLMPGQRAVAPREPSTTAIDQGPEQSTVAVGHSSLLQQAADALGPHGGVTQAQLLKAKADIQERSAPPISGPRPSTKRPLRVQDVLSRMAKQRMAEMSSAAAPASELMDAPISESAVAGSPSTPPIVVATEVTASAAPARKVHPGLLAGGGVATGLALATWFGAVAPTTEPSAATPTLSPSAAPSAAPSTPPIPSAAPETTPQALTAPAALQQPAPSADAEQPADKAEAAAPREKAAATRRDRKKKKPPTATVELTVGTIPAGASLFIDGRRVGTSPTTIPVPPGPVRIVAKLGSVRRVERLTVPDHNHQTVIDLRAKQ